MAQGQSDQRESNQKSKDKWYRDPVWQFIGVIVSVIGILVPVLLANPGWFTYLVSLAKPTSLSPTSTPTTSVIGNDPYAPNTTLKMYDQFKNASAWEDYKPKDLYTGQCASEKGEYHVTVPKAPFFHLCYAQTAPYKDLDYEIELKIVQGDCGALVLRANKILEKFYFFRICQNGSFQFLRYDKKGELGYAHKSEPSDKIHIGLGKTNLIAISARDKMFTLYINKQQVGKVEDDTYSNGQIGIAADCDDDQSTTDVIFSNLKVWTPNG
ncbi:hypothetical protein [Ktedonospora formicarum]|uniref:Ubiquitin-like protease family profile domain-containing protein n=1 Tax=Ktedonospora formicarum TaxID=2778364 RepID=A0A8J3IHV3_9CHLR|nr:hypothetical protein [Ktedonospora formicarum]GHO51444.1 hypothetical protein KSX_96070 [Ktedonospora formicarum]